MNQNIFISTFHYLFMRLWVATRKADKSAHHKVTVSEEDFNTIREGRALVKKAEVPSKNEWDEWARNLPAKFLESQSTRNSQLL